MKQIYLDSEDEITDIINKLEELSDETVALIPPKRSTTLQSVVNLKLLKKAAAAGDVSLVLITRDPAILNVASQLKLLTAANLESEPMVAEPATAIQEMPGDTIDGSQPSESDLRSADKAAAKIKKPKPDNAKVKKGKKVPDFDRFKKIILIGLAALFLIGGGVWGLFNLLPNADIAIAGRTQDVEVDFSATFDPAVDSSNIEEALLAAESRQAGRTLTGTFNATGEKTVGEAATGQVTISNCQNSTGITIPSGTAVTAANGRVFHTDQSVNVPGGVFEPTCTNPGTATVGVTANAIGSGHNIGPTSYTVSGYSADNVSGQGGNMTGGSEERVSVITASDVEKAREELLESERDSVKEELKRQFNDEDFIIETSFRANVSSTSTEPEVGEEATSGRLILQVSYTMLAVNQEELEELLEHRYLSKIEDDSSLAAIETGIDTAEFTATDDNTVFRVEAGGVIGPDINVDKLKDEVAGLSYREAIDLIESRPNVNTVQIDLSPFWSSKVPKNTARINIEFVVNGSNADDSSD